MSQKIQIVLILTAALGLSGCTEMQSMLAGGAKGFCAHNPGDGPCTRSGPVSTPGAPPR